MAVAVIAVCQLVAPNSSTMTLMQIIRELVTIAFILHLEKHAAFAMALPDDHRINITDNCVLMQSLVVHIRDFVPYTIVKSDGDGTNSIETMLIETIAEKIGVNIEYHSERPSNVSGTSAERLVLYLHNPRFSHLQRYPCNFIESVFTCTSVVIRI